MIMHNNGYGYGYGCNYAPGYCDGGHSNTGPYAVGITALVASILPYFMNNGCGNGAGFRNGCGCDVGSAVLAENGELKAIIAAKDEVSKLKKELLQGWIKPLADESAENKTRVAVMRKELECCCTANSTAIAQVSKILNGITQTVIPNGAICPGWGPVLTSPVVTDPKATAVNVIGKVNG